MNISFMRTRLFHFFTLLLLAISNGNTVMAQPNNIVTTSLQVHSEEGVTVVKRMYAAVSDYILITEQGDSILFYTLINDSLHYHFESVWLEPSKQLDGAGREELIVKLVLEDTRHRHTKTMFILNPDSKEVIFEAIYVLQNREERWEYSFSTVWNERNELIVDYGMHSTTHPNSEVKEGVYTLKNGKFTWSKPLVTFIHEELLVDALIDAAIVRQSNCEKKLSNYFLFFNNNADSIQFLFNFGCLSSTDKQAKYTMKAQQLDGVGSQEIIMEFESFGYQTAFTETIIFNLDAGEVMFRILNIGSGIHIRGEEWGDYFNWYYAVSFELSGNLVVEKVSSSEESDEISEGVYILENGVYTLSTN